MPILADPSMTVAAGRDAVDTLMSQAADQAALGADVGSRIQEQFGTWQQSADVVALHGLLPLAMTLLILHQLYESSLHNQAFSARGILIRIAVVAALLVAYGSVVRLITGVAGGSGQWADWDAIVGPVARGAGQRFDMYSDGISIAEIPGLLLWLVLLSMVLFCTLLAYVAALLLSIAQGVLLAIILALGKTCIVVSLVPGIGLGKSWAKYLAMVAAWSAVAGIVSNVVLGHVFAKTADKAVYGGDVGFMLQTAGIYLVFAIFTLSVPRITSALFSGASSAAPGVFGALAMGMLGARMAGRTAARGTDRAVGQARKKLGIPRDADKGRGPDDGRRPHKARRGEAAGDGDGEYQASGHERHAGAAARGYDQRGGGGKAAVAAEPAPAAAIPSGRPGERRFERGDAVSDEQRAAFRSRQRAPLSALEAPPSQNRAMTERARRHGETLRRAYPSLRFQPRRLGARERAALSELDAPHGRFAGWEAGAQGRRDFADALDVADRRVQAEQLGQARPAAAYPASGGSSAPAAAASPAAPRAAGTAHAPEPARVSPNAGDARTAHGAAVSPPAARASRGEPENVRAPGRDAAATEVDGGSRRARAVHERVIPRDSSPAAGAAGDASEPARRVHKLPPKGGR